MPGDVKSEEIWTTLNSKTRLVTLFSRSETPLKQSRVPTVTREQLRRRSLPLDRLDFERNDSIEKAILRGNFTVYQGGDLNKFFGCDVFAPKNISEVCLVNDHYILVKMPETHQKIQHGTPYTECLTSDTSKPSSTSNSFGKHLHRGNVWNRRVSPIPEVPNSLHRSSVREGASTSWSSNGCIKEVFKSRTILKGNTNVFQSSSSKSTEAKSSEHATESKEPVGIERLTSGVSSTKSIYRSPLQTSLNHQVNLEIHGRLEIPNEGQNDSTNIPVKQVLPRPRRPFGLTFRWFLRSFRTKAQSTTKSTITAKTTKKKINAVVYKTFFVRWTKAGQPTSCPNCRFTKKPLRRTRSAIF